MTTPDNQRGLSRNNVDHDIRLIDEASGETLGKLVNIHQEGLMIISQANVLTDNLYQVTLITNNKNIDPISLGLDCMWQRDLEQGEGCWAGFRIISISEPALLKIEQLVKLYGLQTSNPSA